MIKKLLLATAALALSSCSSPSKRQAQHTSLDLYRQAKTCEQFTALASQKDFILRQLSLIKAHTICENSQNLEPVPDAWLEQEPWLASAILEQRIAEAQRQQKNKELSEAYFKKALLETNSKDKLQILRQSEEAAKKSGDVALLTQVQDRILQVAPRFIKNPKPEQYYKVAADFIFQRDFKKGRSLLKQIKTSEEYAARKLYRNSFKIEQEKKQYLKECERFAEWVEKNGTPAQIHEAFVTWARTLWTQGQRARGEKVLTRLETIPNYQGPLDEIEYIRGRMKDEAKDYTAALIHYDKAEKHLKEKSIYKERILFSKAWDLRRLSRFPEAVEAFDKLKTTTEDNSEKARATFWKARSLKQANEALKADQELENLGEEDPLGYYGLLSYYERNQDLPKLEVDTKDIAKPASISTAQNDLALSLADVQEDVLLEKYLNQQMQKRNSSDESLYYLKLYARAGLYLPLFAELTKLQSTDKKTILLKHPELIFPERYSDLVQTWSDKFKIPKSFTMSIIRQESAFNPKARSGADALGLMQLLPQVAKAQTSKTGVSIDHFEDLYLPEKNIPAGVALLSSLKHKYKERLILMAAAYNASEDAIEGWLKARQGEDTLEFIENIPYEETKTYIKTVLRNYIFYSRLEKQNDRLAFPRSAFDL